MNIRRFKPLLYFFLGLGLLALSITSYKFYSMLASPMFTIGEPVILELKPRSGALDLVELLCVKHLIPSKTFFLNFIKFKGLTQHLKAGVYQINPGESAYTFMYRVVAGDAMRMAFKIIDGTTVRQITEHLKNAPYLHFQETDWNLVKNHYPSTEGLLLADTYLYLGGSSAQPLLKTANQCLHRYLDAAWHGRDSQLPYKNAYEMLTVASIVEKETAIPQERKLISGVIFNRILKHMPLQMDPSVVYALGESYRGKLSHADLSVDSPYNTYRYKGLPPTPIAMVGKLAIDAAAHPQHSDYLYFVAKGDGSHVFSKTYEEQKHAISKFLLKKH